MNLSERWSALLDEARALGRHRTLCPPSGIDLASNDYLGYGSGARAGLAEFTSSKFPCSGTASRLLRGEHAIWTEVEAELARWHGAGAALIMTSGYAANEGLLSTVIEPDDWVASDELNHASIIDGLRLARAERYVYRHLDLDHFEAGLRTTAAKRSARRQLFIVTESLFGMDGDLAPLSRLTELAARYDAQLVVDEAHATGCFGTTGSGCVDAELQRSRVLARRWAFRVRMSVVRVSSRNCWLTAAGISCIRRRCHPRWARGGWPRWPACRSTTMDAAVCMRRQRCSARS